MPSITNLATNATISTVEKKILKVSDLVKKNRLRCKNKRHWKKSFFTTSDYNKSTNDIQDEKIKNYLINLIFLSL